MTAAIFDKMTFDRQSLSGNPPLETAIDIGLMLQLLRELPDSGGKRCGIDAEWFSAPRSRLKRLAAQGPDPERLVTVLKRLLRPKAETANTYAGMVDGGDFTILALDIDDDIESGLCVAIHRAQTDITLSLCTIEQFEFRDSLLSFYAWYPLIGLQPGKAPRLLAADKKSARLQFRVDCLANGSAAKRSLASFSGVFRLHERKFDPCRLDLLDCGPVAKGDHAEVRRVATIAGSDPAKIIGDIVAAGESWLAGPLGGSEVSLADLLEAGKLIERRQAAAGGGYALSPTGQAMAARLIPGGTSPDRNLPSIDWPAMVAKLGQVVKQALLSHPASPVFQRGDQFGLRLTLDDLVVLSGSNPATDPRLTLQLGKWLPAAADRAAWGGEQLAARPGLGDRAGVELMLLEKPSSGGTVQLLGKPVVRLNAVGFDLQGGSAAPLLARRGYALGAAGLRVYWDSGSGGYGIGLRLGDITLPLDGSGAGKNDPAGQILANIKPDDKTPPARFSLELSYIGRNADGKQPGSFDVRLADHQGQPTDVIWLPLQRDFGPLTLDKLGLGLRKAGNSWELMAAVSGRVSLAGIKLELSEAGLALRLDQPTRPRAFLKGMSLAFKRGAVEVTGGFLEIKDGVYGGQLSVTLPKCAVSVLGLYGTYPVPGSTEKVTSLFVYGTASLTGGAGIKLGALTITGLALGFGLNRRVVLPAIGAVADFPLIRQVMGGGSAKPAADMLRELETHLPFAPGQMFACLGLRFTIAEAIDAFALAVVQFGKDLELSLLGLARFEKSAGETRFCRIELAIRMTLRPAEGTFLLQAELTANSWVFDENCRLTGGFALGIWFAGQRKGDFVLTLGGYHPKFKAPEHYPSVPRLGMNWRISDSLSFKGELYCALTPSHMMAGGRLEAAYNAGRIKAWFVAAVDFLMKWAPLEYELEAGIAIRIEADLPLKNLSLSLDVGLRLSGPPFAGRAEFKVAMINVVIEFGSARKTTVIENWSQFAGQFLKGSAEQWARRPAAGGTAAGPPVCAPSVVRGLLARPGEGQSDGPWVVRGDEVEFAVASIVPATEVHFGAAAGSASGIPRRDGGADRNMVLSDAVALGADARCLGKARSALGVAPLAVASLRSDMKITIVRDLDGGGVETVDLRDWIAVADAARMPAALWGDKPAGSEPSAKLTGQCFTGLASCKPPAGRTDGDTVKVGVARHAQAERPLPQPEIAVGTTRAVVKSHDLLADLIAPHDERLAGSRKTLAEAGFPDLLAAAVPAADAARWQRSLQAQPLVRQW